MNKAGSLFKITIGILFLGMVMMGCSKGSDGDGQNSASKVQETVETASEVSDSNSPVKTDALPDNSSASSGEELIKEISRTMPVISIQTKEGYDGGLAFIDEPVSRHVATDIASWTPGYVIPPEPYYVDCTVSVLGDGFTGLIDNADASVKVRGNWTTTYDKKPLRIKFDKKQNILGMHDGKEYKNWILLAEYKDASMLRNRLALEVSRNILKEDGLYASDAMPVTVFVNGDYRGVYILAEQQELKGGRVEGTSNKKDYTGNDIGYLLEFDTYYYSEDPLNRFHISYADNEPLIPYDGNGGSGRALRCLPDSENSNVRDIGFTIKSDINCESQRDFIASYMDNVYRILYFAANRNECYVFNDDFTRIERNDNITPREAIERVIDVNSLADMYIISELTCDADLYLTSFFMSVDFGEEGNKKLTFQAPWDFDSSMGNKYRCPSGSGFYAAGFIPDVNYNAGVGPEYETVNPWLCVIAYQDWYMDIVREKWTKAYDANVFSNAVAIIEQDSKTYADEFVRNYDKWKNILHSSFVSELSTKARNCFTQAQAKDYLVKWFNSRVEWLNEQWHN